MSKKAILRALAHVRAGHLKRALEEIERLDRGFIRRRLTHYASQPDHREAAAQLKKAWEATVPTQSSGARPAPAPFLAPLAPAEVASAPRDSISFDDPVPFLRWVSGVWDRLPELRLADLAHVDVWALAALACLAFPERPRRPPLVGGGTSGVAQFAYAVGLDAVLGGRPGAPPLEVERTVPLRRVKTRGEIEPTAEEMSALIMKGVEDRNTRLALKYVLVELLRNVVQHSGDSLGAVAAAQVMGKAQRRRKEMIQLVVADAGIGIPTHLQRQHPHLTDYRQALERALLPHISGTFQEGLTGSFENAGLGLYMISELARQTQGRMLIATTGAALVVEPGARGGSSVKFLEPVGTGFPGTLVAFELPSGAVTDYEDLMQRILRKAQERTPKRAADRWVQFEPGPADSQKLALLAAREDTARAAELFESQIRPAILERRVVELDFDGLDLCTQSWLHALLFEAVRLAWALRVPIHVVRAVPAVQEGLRFLEAYALGG